MSPTFTAGAQVFLENGQIVEFVAMLPEGSVVRPLYESEDEEPHYGKPFTVQRVYAEAPLARFHEEALRLATANQEAGAKLTAARAEIAEFERDERNRKARLARHEEFALLDDFLAGNITHVVVASYGAPSIAPFDDWIKNRDDRGRDDGLKLLTLFGRTGGKLSWGINRYYDGSGSNTTVYPAKSHEAAVEICRGIWDAAMAEYREKTGYLHGLNYWIEAADKLGLVIPPDLAARWHESALKGAEEALAKAEAELATKAAAVAALCAQAPAEAA